MNSKWTESDFDSLGWHDVHVHGFRVTEGEHGTGQLILDLDYILEWIHPDTEGGSFRFRIAPASLVFHDVFGLCLALDYESPTAGMGPFSIDGIERKSLTHDNGYQSFRWSIGVNWPKGHIEFVSSGFTQTQTGPVVETGSQSLTTGERNGDSPVD